MEHHQPPVSQPLKQTEPEVERTQPAEQTVTATPAMAQDVPPSGDSPSVPVSHDYDGQPDQVLQRGTGPSSQVSQQSNKDQLANSGNFHEKLEILDLTERDNNDETHSAPPPADEDQPVTVPEVQPAAVPEVQTPRGPDQNPATSTISAEDLGLPLQCNLCDREISSKNFQKHCLTDHNITRPNIRTHAKAVEANLPELW